MKRLALPVLLAVTFAIASSAHASVITYGCGKDICRVNPDGSGRTQVTSDGSHRDPSASRDGTHVSWLSGFEDLFTGTSSAGSPVGPLGNNVLFAAMRPDGTQVASVTSNGDFPGICIYATSGSSKTCQVETVTTIGWAPDGHLLIDGNANGDPAFPGPSRSYQDDICILVSVPDGHCSRAVAYDPDHTLADPAVSPDGSVVAVTAEAPGSGIAGYIALYNYATGKLLKNLTSGTTDSQPAWSPDGESLVFDRGNGLDTISATGSPGSEKPLVTSGESPSWSAGGDTGGGSSSGGRGAPSAAATSTQHGQTVRGSVTLTATSKVKVQLVVKSGGDAYVVGSSTTSSVSAGKHSFAVKLSSKAAKALKKIHSIPITVVVTVTPDGGDPVTLQKKITLKH